MRPTLLGLAVAGALAAPLPAQEPALQDDISRFTLANGLEGVVIEDHRAPVVTSMLWYKVGSADEPPGQSGVAHFLEHLMFKGTAQVPEGRFSRTVSENGGEDNAFTSYDYTGYFQSIAADLLGLVLEMEADRMVNLDLNEAAVASEREVVREERRQVVENSPNALFNEQRRAALYLNHPYGDPIIGWMHEIEMLTRETALDFYRTYYAPNNAVLVVAGDVTPAEVERLAKEHFGPIPAVDTIPTRVRPQEPPHLARRWLEFVDPRVAQPSVGRLYLAPTRRSGDQGEAAALSVLGELLGGSGITSVMARELVLGDGVALDAGAFYSETGLDPQSFGVYVVPKPGTTPIEAEAAMDALLARFVEQGPEPAQLERIKTRLRAGEIYALDNQMGRARRVGAALTTGLTIEDVEAWPEALAAVTAEDVVAAARTVFRPESSVTGYLLPPETPEIEQ